MDFLELPKIDLLDHGFIRRIDSMGNDLSVIRAARVSHNAPWRTGKDEGNDLRLLRRLWTGGKKVNIFEHPRHSTPFEAGVITFEVMAPIFVYRQWHRHRTQSYNELSARYRELPEVFYVPKPEQVGGQDAKEKQARNIDALVSEERLGVLLGDIERYKESCSSSFQLYRHLLGRGWPREVARAVLPFATYSHMFVTANLLNWLRFMTLRCESHAQYEIRVYSDAIADLLHDIFPETIALWREGTMNFENVVKKLEEEAA